MSEIWSTTYVCLHVNYPLFLSHLNYTSIFSTDFRKLLKYQISRKSVLLEPSCFMRTDGQSWRNSWSLSAILWTCLKIWLCRFCDNSDLLLRNILYTAAVNPHAQYGRHKPATRCNKRSELNSVPGCLYKELQYRFCIRYICRMWLQKFRIVAIFVTVHEHTISYVPCHA
jgi:hypothetical protein